MSFSFLTFWLYLRFECGLVQVPPLDCRESISKSTECRVACHFNLGWYQSGSVAFVRPPSTKRVSCQCYCLEYHQITQNHYCCCCITEHQSFRPQLYLKAILSYRYQSPPFTLRRLWWRRTSFRGTDLAGSAVTPTLLAKL